MQPNAVSQHLASSDILHAATCLSDLPKIQCVCRVCTTCLTVQTIRILRTLYLFHYGIQKKTVAICRFDVNGLHLYL
jgi:hypothetical protein